MLANVVPADAHAVQLFSNQRIERIQAHLVLVAFARMEKSGIARRKFEQPATREQQRVLVEHVKRVVEHNQTATRSNVQLGFERAVLVEHRERGHVHSRGERDDASGANNKRRARGSKVTWEKEPFQRDDVSLD